MVVWLINKIHLTNTCKSIVPKEDTASEDQFVQVYMYLQEGFASAKMQKHLSFLCSFIR